MFVVFALLLMATYYRPASTFPLLAYGLALAIPVSTAFFIFRGDAINSVSFTDIAPGLLVAAGYSLAVIYLVNGAFSSSPPRRIRANVESKIVRTGRRMSHNYRLRLSSTDPAGDGEWTVSPKDFEALSEGTVACIDLYRSALGADWYRAGVCPDRSDEMIPWNGISDAIFDGSAFLSVEFYNSAK